MMTLACRDVVSLETVGILPGAVTQRAGEAVVSLGLLPFSAITARSSAWLVVPQRPSVFLLPAAEQPSRMDPSISMGLAAVSNLQLVFYTLIAIAFSCNHLDEPYSY